MDVGGLDAWAWSRICNLKTLTLKAGGLAAEEYVKIDQGWLYRLWNSRYFAGSLCGGSYIFSFANFNNYVSPPLRGPVGKGQGHPSARRPEESKVQLLVSAQMFGQVVMRVYNGNLGDSRSNSLDWVPECGSPRSLLESMFE